MAEIAPTSPRALDVLESHPPPYRDRLLELRALILEVAGLTDGVGSLTETLKWGQPSYLTEETGAGTTIRIDRHGGDRIALLVHCQTTLVEEFRGLFPQLEFEKNRAVVLDPHRPLPKGPLARCIEMALTYKLAKKR